MCANRHLTVELRRSQFVLLHSPALATLHHQDETHSCVPISLFFVDLLIAGLALAACVQASALTLASR